MVWQNDLFDPSGPENPQADPVYLVFNNSEYFFRGVVFQSFIEIFGIKYGIRNVLKIYTPLNTKYLVGFVAPPLGLYKETPKPYSHEL